MNVHLARHAESWFNRLHIEGAADPGVIDPLLTQEGRRQAETLAEHLGRAGVDAVVCSPYSRALETAEVVARKTIPVMVDARLRERRYFNCDIGTPRSILVRRWPAFDFRPFAERWWESERETVQQFTARAGDVLLALAELEGRTSIAVVTHSGIIEALTGRAISTGDVRSYDAADLARRWHTLRPLPAGMVL